VPLSSSTTRDSSRPPMRSTITRSRTFIELPGMKIHAHKIDSEGNLQECAADEALERGSKPPSVGGAGKDDNNNYWIDVDADERDEEELREWLQKLPLSSFMMGRLAEPAHTWNSHVIALRSSALAMIRILPGDEDTEDHITFLAAITTHGLLLTFTSCPRTKSGGLGAKAMEHMKEPECLPHGSSSGALLAWLLFHVERTAHSMREVKSRTMELAEMIDNDPSKVSFAETMELKSRLLRVIAVAEEQTECISTLKRGEKDTTSLDFSKTRGTLSVLFGTAKSTERMGLRVEKRLADIRQHQESYQQERINGRLALLTVLSAIFLPLTLISGIYGMNFDNMPHLHREHGYQWTLGFMGAIAAILICTFRLCGGFR
jgi:Mg2+ and Co2+ transporter CorA